MSSLGLLKRIKELFKPKYQCLECGKCFDSSKGLNIHKTMVHKKKVYRQLPWDWMKDAKKESERDRIYQ